MKKTELKQIIKEELKRVFEAKYKFTKNKWQMRGPFLIVYFDDSKARDEAVTWIKNLGDDVKAAGDGKIAINIQDVCNYYLNNHL